MKKAIIDLGTNTCNLLIAEVKNNTYHILHTSKVAVKLGEGGINNGNITPEATQRAIHALNTHLESMKAYGAINNIQVIATSAVRDAQNKTNFAKQIKEATQLDLTIINGNEEANYIFKGVQLALKNIPDNCLIMDIGGGSNEFIIVKNNQIAWKQSFPTGIARVIERFKLSNPITNTQCEEINQWFEENMLNLWEQIQQHNINTLIGCSGSFDTIVDIIENTEPNTKTRINQPITIAQFNNVATQLITSTTQQRIELKTIENMRVEMIVPAILLIQLVVRKFAIQQIIQTDYSLKEGALL